MAAKRSKDSLQQMMLNFTNLGAPSSAIPCMQTVNGWIDVDAKVV
jgi:hypothetical protein